MSWSVGYNSRHRRFIGYGVPAYCDHPGCNAEIDRGLSYVCGGDVYGGEHGCGLHFCEAHRQPAGDKRDNANLCTRCYHNRQPDYTPKKEHPDWISHMLTDESWEQWRTENPDEVKRLQEQKS